MDKWISTSLLPEKDSSLNISPICGMELSRDRRTGDAGHRIFKYHFHNEMWTVLDKLTNKQENQKKVMKP